MTNDNMTFTSDFSSSGSNAADVIINGDVFRMDGMIYQGNDSRIFSAHSLQSGGDSAFVIKCLTCPKDGDVWRMAMREIEAGNLLRRCPNVVPLRGYSVIADRNQAEYQLFLLFDRLQCLDNMEISDTRVVLEICRDICRALAFMRKKGLMHGDVKPRNIYSDGEKWLLGDLGSVCVAGEVPQYGSEGYLSPEAARGESCDIRADLYSLGITVYKLLSGGRLPFCDLPCAEMSDSDVYLAIRRRLSGEEIPPLPGVNCQVNNLLRKLCRFRREDRFKKPSDAAEFVQKLLLASF